MTLALGQVFVKLAKVIISDFAPSSSFMTLPCF